MNKRIEKRSPADRLDLELKRHLRDVGNEEQPENLLALARQLQDLLRKRSLDDE